MSQAAHIEARTIDGVCYLASHDVARALRQRADEVEASALTIGEDPYGSGYVDVVAFPAIALELRERADAIEFGVIAHLTEQPGDSDSDLGHAPSPTPGG